MLARKSRERKQFAVRWKLCLLPEEKHAAKPLLALGLPVAIAGQWWTPCVTSGNVEMKAVFDSDVLIDYMQGITKAKKELDRYRQPLYSMISFIELHCGARNAVETRAVDILLSTLSRVEISEEIARRAVDLRRELRLKLPDAVVLASAEVEGCILVTRNIKDFPKKDPRVRFPYTI